MFEIHCVPIHQDNYVWIIGCDGQAWVFDPGDHLPVLNLLQEKQLRLAGVLLTHRHADHVAGVLPLLAHFRTDAVPVYGPISATIQHLISNPVTEGDQVRIGPLLADVWCTPGHTLDHISYHFRADDLLFCGDTLFACGCGRLFDGSIEQLFSSLQRIAALSSRTLIYCTHEYTLANIDFALAVEPENMRLRQRLKECQALRDRNQPTLPSQLGLELETNPFLRSHLLGIKNRVARISNTSINQDFDCFAAMRNWKNGY